MEDQLEKALREWGESIDSLKATIEEFSKALDKML